MIYLCSPYSHPDPAVMEQRFQLACLAAGHLMGEGFVVFSPIAHTHPIAVRCQLPRGWDYWEEFDTEFIQAATEVYVLELDEWEQSKGIAAEIAIAKRLGKPVEYLVPGINFPFLYEDKTNARV